MTAWMLPTEAIVDLPPEMSGGLTFHLPMELIALRDAGAPDSEISVRTHDRLVEAYAAGLIDPPMYRWAVQRYQDVAESLLSSDRAARVNAFRTVEALGDGVAGAAFHGLIRLGYGAWQHDASEIARGLAYLRTRRQVLASTLQDPDAAGGDAAEASDDLPSIAERDGATVFDLLSIAAGSGEPARLAAEARTRRVRSLLQTGLRLVRRNPSSFVAVHALTGFHGLCEVHRLVCGEAPSDSTIDTAPTSPWWDSFGVAVRACALLVESEPPEVTAAFEGDVPVQSIDDLVRASITSADTHDVKVSVALRRLMHLGLLSEDEAVSVGLCRLAAGQLS